MLISQQLACLNAAYAQRNSLTNREKLDLVHARITLQNIALRHGGELVFDDISNAYAFRLQARREQKGDRS